MTLEELIEDVLDAYTIDQIKLSPHSYIHQIADDCVPVYNGDRIREWLSLPVESQDVWQDNGHDDGATIVDLMAIDLYYYYFELASLAIDRIMKEGN
jgi:predicted metalloprotease with PDZ domain